MNKACGTLLEKWGRTHKFSCGPLHVDVPVLADQQLTYNGSVWTQGVVYKTWQEQWIIGINVERESGKSVVAERHEDDGLNLLFHEETLVNKYFCEKDSQYTY